MINTFPQYNNLIYTYMFTTLPCFWQKELKTVCLNEITTAWQWRDSVHSWRRRAFPREEKRQEFMIFVFSCYRYFQMLAIFSILYCWCTRLSLLSSMRDVIYLFYTCSNWQCFLGRMNWLPVWRSPLNNVLTRDSRRLSFPSRPICKAVWR